MTEAKAIDNPTLVRALREAFRNVDHSVFLYMHILNTHHVERGGVRLYGARVRHGVMQVRRSITPVWWTLHDWDEVSVDGVRYTVR